MCGICGKVSFQGNISTDHLINMTRVLRHRGPDDEGFILSNTRNNITRSFHHDETIDELKYKTPRLENNITANLGFGFRRLSILDLSENGHQPMQFEEAGLWIVFNGEIYNYIELRNELIEHRYKFNSNTDTEVILKSYHKWGEKCVHKFNGMWAFVIWDTKNKKLFCSRDRFGIKPFYYNYEPDSHFIFASEIKSILQVIKSTPDKQTLLDNFYTGYSDHCEKTFFENISQLRGGHNLILQEGKLVVYKYYSLDNQPSNDSFAVAKDKLRELLFDAVRIRLRSDVPLGYALSGGVDSSSIVGVASSINTGSNNTFSMIYPGNKIDESFFVNKVIEKTDVIHHFVSPNPNDFISDLDNFIWHQEEPFIGTSYYGEFKLRQLIRKNNITVSLEGQGADEIISGYTSLLFPFFFDLISNFKVSNFIKEYGHFNENINNPAKLIKTYLRRNKKRSNGYLFSKYTYLNQDFFDGIHTNVSNFQNLGTRSYLNNALYEMLMYTSIPQQLVRADKNAMAFSVECRFPFLDYRLVEHAINLPFDYKIKNGMTKYILREAVKDLLPLEVYNRTDKIGFAIPNEKFNTSEVAKHFLENWSNKDFGNFNFIDVPKFLTIYRKDNAQFDWKFWKIVSVLFWYNAFFD